VRILGDSQITNASISATNISSAGLTEKLQTFQLTDNMRTIGNTTIIDIDFAGDVNEVDAVALCGSNLSSNAVVSLSYSNTNIGTPDATIVLPQYSPLNQVFFLDSALEKRYWRISITDASISNLFIGYIYIGKYFQVPATAFGHGASFDMNSIPIVTPTGQGYGSKIYNSLPLDFTMYLNYAELVEYLNIKEVKQNIDPVLVVKYEDSLNLELYRPKYGVLVNESVPFPMIDDPLTYEVSDRLEERF
jgi:hypothetical protein